MLDILMGLDELIQQEFEIGLEELEEEEMEWEHFNIAYNNVVMWDQKKK